MDGMDAHAALTSHAHRLRDLGAVAFVLLAVVFFALSWSRFAAQEAPMSVIDEHVHLDTHLKMHAGGYPHRGSLMGQEVVEEWACGVGHDGGPTTVPCGSPDLGPASLPSGEYTSGYIHYPTYFAAAEVHRWVAGRVVDDVRPLTIYRIFSALLLSAGIVVSGIVAWVLALRGSALVAASLVPVAASGIAVFGTMANPSSAMVVCGALIAGTGILWLRTGRGFWWLAVAGALGAVVSVTASLPLGAFILAALGGAMARRRGVRFVGGWRPRWWHVAVLTLIAVAPVVVYGAVIDAQATQSDEVLYAFYGDPDRAALTVGAVGELFALHSPWFEAGGFDAAEGGLVERSLRSAAVGGPMLLNILLFGVLAVATLSTALSRSGGANRPTESGQRPADGASTDPLRLLAGATLLGILLYPPAMRVSNALNMGVDHGIVARYSMGFAPLVVLICLLLMGSHRGYVRTTAVLGALGVLGLGVGAW